MLESGFKCLACKHLVYNIMFVIILLKMDFLASDLYTSNDAIRFYSDRDLANLFPCIQKPEYLFSTVTKFLTQISYK